MLLRFFVRSASVVDLFKGTRRLQAGRSNLKSSCRSRSSHTSIDPSVRPETIHTAEKQQSFLLNCFHFHSICDAHMYGHAALTDITLDQTTRSEVQTEQIPACNTHSLTHIHFKTVVGIILASRSHTHNSVRLFHADWSHESIPQTPPHTHTHTRSTFG